MVEQAHTLLVWVPVEVVDPPCVETRGATDDSVDLIPFASNSSARYEPSCPEIPVIMAFFIFSLIVPVRG